MPLTIDRNELDKIYGNKDHATLMLVLGFASLGKTTSLRTLPPEHTYIINVVGKDLPFPSAGLYQSDPLKSGKQGNICTLHDPLKIPPLMTNVSREREEIDYLVIDDATYIMAQEFMDKANITGWDKFTQMASHLWTILRTANTLRPTLKVILIGHLDEEMGKEGSHAPLVMKTVGKLTREKLTPEGLSTIILVPAVERIGNDGNARYWFYTQSDGFNPARSPMGMFPYRCRNDMKAICDRINEYYMGVPLEDSEIDLELEEVEAPVMKKMRTLPLK